MSEEEVRCELAAKILQRLIANAKCDDDYGLSTGRVEHNVRLAVAYADALLAELG